MPTNKLGLVKEVRAPFLTNAKCMQPQFRNIEVFEILVHLNGIIIFHYVAGYLASMLP